MVVVSSITVCSSYVPCKSFHPFLFIFHSLFLRCWCNRPAAVVVVVVVNRQAIFQLQYTGRQTDGRRLFKSPQLRGLLCTTVLYRQQHFFVVAFSFFSKLWWWWRRRGRRRRGKSLNRFASASTSAAAIFSSLLCSFSKHKFSQEEGSEGGSTELTGMRKEEKGKGIQIDANLI